MGDQAVVYPPACGEQSLFPYTSVLEEQQRWVDEVFVADEGLHRLTLTAAAINQAALVVFLVSGSGKALILRNVLREAQDPRSIPARLIKPVDGRLLWLVDRDAARLLRTQERSCCWLAGSGKVK